jgi:hypothetical protein
MPVTFPPPGIKVLTIGELTRALKGMLEQAYDSVWVEGEVSNLSRPSAYGHQYLTLKDDEAPLKAVLYRAIALRMRFDLRDGMCLAKLGHSTFSLQGTVDRRSISRFLTSTGKEVPGARAAVTTAAERAAQPPAHLPEGRSWMSRTITVGPGTVR